MKRFHKFTNRDLINGIISRDEEIIKRIYELYYETVRYLVIKNNGTNDDAMDVFQNAILVLFQKLRDASFKLTCSLKTYIFSTARVIWLKELKKRKKYVDLFNHEDEFIDATMDIAEIYERNERLLLYRSIFEQMSQNCKEILTLFLEGRSIKEITRKMGYKNEQHTKNRCYRCKQALIKRIKNTYGYEELKHEKDEVD